MAISKEGQRFIEEMRSYLRVKGVNEVDIEDFLEEARVHIEEGEQDGKTIRDIFGQSPKSYAQDLVDSMETSPSENTKLLSHFIVGAFGYLIGLDAIEGNIQYSMIELIGYPLTFVIWLVVVVFGFRLTAFRNQTSQFLLLYVIILVPFAMQIGVALLSENYGEPVIQLTGTVSYVAAAVMACVVFAVFTHLLHWQFSLIYCIVIFGIPILFQSFDLDNIMWSLIQYFAIAVGLFLIFYLKKPTIDLNSNQ